MVVEKTLDQILAERKAQRKPKLPAPKHESANDLPTRAMPATSETLAKLAEEAGVGQTGPQEVPKLPKPSVPRPAARLAVVPKPSASVAKDETDFGDLTLDDDTGAAAKPAPEPPKAAKSPSEPPVAAPVAEPGPAEAPKVEEKPPVAEPEKSPSEPPVAAPVAEPEKAAAEPEKTKGSVAVPNNIEARVEELEGKAAGHEESIEAMGSDLAGETDTDGNVTKKGLLERVEELEGFVKTLVTYVFGNDIEGALKMLGNKPAVPVLTQGMMEALEGVVNLEVERAVGPLSILLLKPRLTNGDVKNAVKKYGENSVGTALHRLGQVEGYAKSVLIEVRELDTPEKLAASKGLDQEASAVKAIAGRVLADFDNIVGKTQ